MSLTAYLTLRLVAAIAVSKSSRGPAIVASTAAPGTTIRSSRQPEAGVALQGTEAKSLREGQASLADSLRHHRRRRSVDSNAHPRNTGTAALDQPRAATQPQTACCTPPIDTLVGKIREGNFALMPLSLVFRRRQGC